MFTGRRFSVAGRVIAGLLLIHTIVYAVRGFILSEMDYLLTSLGFPLLLCLIYLCVLLVPSAYRSSPVVYVLSGVAIGAWITGLVAWQSGLEILGAVTGGLLGGLIAHGLAVGVVDPVLAGVVLFSGLSALFGPYPRSEAFGGSMAVPGGALGASIIWACRNARGPKTASLILAGVAFLFGVSGLFGPPIALGWKLAGACCFLGASILGMCWKPRPSQSADTPAYRAQSVSTIGIATVEWSEPTQADTGHFEASAKRRSPGTVRRIMIAVVCCAFVLSALTKDAKGALEGMTNHLLLLGGPASGVVLQRRRGGRGVLGGAIAGSVTHLSSTAATYAWLYWNPQIGMLPEPFKQIVHSAICGATFGVVIGVLIWGVMLTERTSETDGEICLRDDRPLSTQANEQAMSRPRFQLGVMAAGVVLLLEPEIAGTVGQSGYAFILAAWVLLFVAFGFGIVRILRRAVTNKLNSTASAAQRVGGESDRFRHVGGVDPGGFREFQ